MFLLGRFVRKFHLFHGLGCHGSKQLPKTSWFVFGKKINISFSNGMFGVMPLKKRVKMWKKIQGTNIPKKHRYVSSEETIYVYLVL